MILPLWVALIFFAVIILGIALFGVLESFILFSFGPSLLPFLAVVAFWSCFTLILLWTMSAVGASDWGAPLIDFSTFFGPSGL